MQLMYTILELIVRVEPCKGVQLGFECISSIWPIVISSALCHRNEEEAD